METLKKETRYMVEPFQNPVLTDVMVDESGVVFLWYEKEENEWIKTNDYLKFFISEAEAMNYARSLFPSDMDKVKAYLEYIEEDEPDKLKEYLPKFIYDMYDKGRKSTNYTYSEIAQIKEALSGNININACTFRKEQVSRIKWSRNKGEYEAKIILTDGTEICTHNSTEYGIIRSIFGDNHSGMSYTSTKD